jgi:hypothetical protein
MSLFKLPKNICKKITDILEQFWWEDDEGKKIHWYVWWNLCFPRGEGGMGFRDLHSFNLAMLAKRFGASLLNQIPLLLELYVPSINLLVTCQVLTF